MTRPAGRVGSESLKQKVAGVGKGREVIKVSRVGSGLFVTSRVELNSGHPDTIRPARET